MQKLDLFNFSKQELEIELKTLNIEPYRVKQIWNWIYYYGKTSFDEMNNISKELRQKLNEKYTIERPKILKHLISKKDGTQKWLLEFENNNSFLLPINKNIVEFTEIKENKQVIEHKVEKQYIDNLEYNLELLEKQEPLCYLNGGEFEKQKDKNFETQALEYFNSMNNKIYSGIFAHEIILNKSSIKGMIVKGLYREKCSALKSISNVLQNGIIINKEINWKDRGYNTYLIVSNVSIKNTEYIVQIVIKEYNNNEKFFYLEEVESKRDFLMSLKCGLVTTSPKSKTHKSILLSFVKNVKQFQKQQIIEFTEIKENKQIIKHKVEKQYIDNLEYNLELLEKQEPLCYLNGGEFSELRGKDLKIGIQKYFDSFDRKVKTSIGNVVLSNSGIKKIFNNLYGLKRSAVKSIPLILKNGIVINKEINWKDRNYNTYLLIGTINIRENDYIVEVIVKEVKEKLSFYLEEIENKKCFLKVRTSLKAGAQGNTYNSILTSFIQNVKQFQNPQILEFTEIKENKQIIKHKVEKQYIDNLEHNIELLREQKSSIFLRESDGFSTNNNEFKNQVKNFFDSVGRIVENNTIGKIFLTNSGIKKTINSGLNKEKCIAIKAIPEILKNAIVINKEINWKEREYNTYLIANIISIENIDYIVEIIVKEINEKNTTEKTYYLENVTDKKIILSVLTSFKAGEQRVSCKSMINTFYQNVKQFQNTFEPISSKEKITAKNTIEMVYIPAEDRGTLCISSQVGCAMGCKFCNTGKQGFTRNLTTAEIVGQLLVARDELKEWDNLNKGIGEGRAISNIVLMGMGEPLLNRENVEKAVNIINNSDGIAFSNRRITLSTCGIVPEIKNLNLKVNLALSLHASNDEIRKQIMPIANKYTIDETLKVCGNYAKKNSDRRITFEYILIGGLNDDEKYARELIRLVKKHNIPAKFNLIPFNEWKGCDFKTSKNAVKFAKILTDAKYPAPIRKSMGSDISAACGQLKETSIL